MLTRRAVNLAYPKGTCKVVPFYFRGDDPFQEQEFLLSELEATRKDIAIKAANLARQRQEYDDISEKLRFCGGFAVKIASELGGDSTITTDHSTLLNEMAELEAKRADLASQIKAFQVLANPIEQTRLLKEHATDVVDLEEQVRVYGLISQSITELKQDLADEACSERYQYSIASLMEARLAQQCKQRVNQDLQRLRNTLNGAPSSPNKKRTAAAHAVASIAESLNPLFDERTEAYLELEEVGLSKRVATLHRRHAVKSAMQMILDLNRVLELLDCAPIDVAEVRSHCDIAEIESEETWSRARTEPSTANVSARSKNTQPG
jgi:hypothetical protein